jgi:hypothetical protein
VSGSHTATIDPGGGQNPRRRRDTPLLWELRLGAAAAGSGVGLQRAWTQAESALGEDRGMLAATYERLRTGQF